jgi:transcriptional regulator with XRE-family HTH domain
MTITSEELREERRRLGMTQAQLADQLGVSRVTVTRWEGGVTIDQPRMLILALESIRRRMRRSSTDGE